MSQPIISAFFHGSETKNDFQLKIGGLVKCDFFFKLVNSDLFFLSNLHMDEQTDGQKNR